MAFREAIFSASCIIARESSYFHFKIGAPQRAGPLEILEPSCFETHLLEERVLGCPHS